MISLPLLSALGGTVILAASPAARADIFVLSPGLTFSADTRGPDGRYALGLEVTGNSVSSKALDGLGFLFQLQVDFDGGVRTLFGGQAFYAGLGLEAGVGWYRPAEGPVTPEVQLAPFASIGYASIAGRVLFSADGVDGGVALAAKYPIGGEDAVPLPKGCDDDIDDGAVCGRPLRDLADRPWRAPIVVGGPVEHDELWAAVEALAPDMRRRLAGAWLEDARDEHAAIAAFCQLAAHLAAHGAPRPLIDGALRAARDEVRHAAQAFSIASALAGRRLRPLPLPPPRRLLPALGRLAAESWLDGAMNEGRAAAEAALAHETAEVPAVRRLLGAIGREEARHAALGLAVAEWAAGRGAAARRALAQARDRQPGIHPPQRARHASERAWGRVG